MRLVLLVIALAGCANTAADHPLTVHLGGTRELTNQRLRDHAYCHHQDGPPVKNENYPRCDRPGPEWGESWVTAIYDGDTVVEIRRWERLTEDAKAVERWNQLIRERNAISPASTEALAALRASGLLQPGTRSVQAFRDGDEVIGIYLLTPSPPEDANILEKIVKLPIK